jgi:hypothetical protein
VQENTQIKEAAVCAAGLSEAQGFSINPQKILLSTKSTEHACSTTGDLLRSTGYYRREPET